MVTTKGALIHPHSIDVEFQSRSQTGHGYNFQSSRHEYLKYLKEFQSRSQTGHGYNRDQRRCY